MYDTSKKEKRHYETKLRSDFKILEEKIDNNEDVHDMYNTVLRELEEIEEENLRGKIVRSRAQWIEEGEKCSKYFMRLENRKLQNQMHHYSIER